MPADDYWDMRGKYGEKRDALRPRETVKAEIDKGGLVESGGAATMQKVQGMVQSLLTLQTGGGFWRSIVSDVKRRFRVTMKGREVADFQALLDAANTVIASTLALEEKQRQLVSLFMRNESIATELEAALKAHLAELEAKTQAAEAKGRVAKRIK